MCMAPLSGLSHPTSSVGGQFVGWVTPNADADNFSAAANAENQNLTGAKRGNTNIAAVAPRRQRQQPFAAMTKLSTHRRVLYCALPLPLEPLCSGRNDPHSMSTARLTINGVLG